MRLWRTPDFPADTEIISQESWLQLWETSAKKNLLILEALMSLEEEVITSVQTHRSKETIPQKIKDVLRRFQNSTNDNTNGSSPIPVSTSEYPATASLTHSKEPQGFGVLPVLHPGDADDDIWQFLNFDFAPSSQKRNSENFQF